jgi:hypothetical protein
MIRIFGGGVFPISPPRSITARAAFGGVGCVLCGTPSLKPEQITNLVITILALHSNFSVLVE